MRRSSKLTGFHHVILGALIGVSILTAGCGAVTQANSATYGEDATPQPRATPSETGATSGQVTPGRVTLTLDKQRYAAKDALVVIIANGLSHLIWAADHRTGCTVLVAEEAHAGAWESVANCHLMTPTGWMALPTGVTVAQLGASGWSAGTYRVTLTYTSSDEGMSGKRGIVHSAEFTVG